MSSRLGFSIDNGVNPDVVLVGVGVETTFEVIAAAALLKKNFGQRLRVRVVNVVDLLVFAPVRRLSFSSPLSSCTWNMELRSSTDWRSSSRFRRGFVQFALSSWRSLHRQLPRQPSSDPSAPLQSTSLRRTSSIRDFWIFRAR